MTPLHGIACFYDVGFGARAVSRKTPIYFIYDNACAAQKSSLRRFPHRVRKWTFLCDRTQWKNHTSCQKGYNMDLYPMLMNVNSQQSEQINRSLRSLSVVLAFSTFEHYMKILEMYFVYKNVKTRKKL